MSRTMLVLAALLAGCGESTDPDANTFVLTSSCDVDFTIAGWWFAEGSQDSVSFGPGPLRAGGSYLIGFPAPGEYWLIVDDVDRPSPLHLLQSPVSVPGTMVLIQDPARSTYCRDAGA